MIITFGRFRMGSAKGNPEEQPIHEVRISKAFYLGKYEVTQEQWERITGSNPSNFKGANLPVELVPWEFVHAFIGRLNGMNDGYWYRLPTEAEWEYACRSGMRGDPSGKLDAISWNYKKSGDETHPVGKKKPNTWGLYDMHGNVQEWVADWFDENYYRSSPAVDPKEPASGWIHVHRGSGWRFPAGGCADRGRGSTGYSSKHLGFRLAAEKR